MTPDRPLDAAALATSSLGFYRVWLAAVGVEEGLFEALSAAPRTAEALAAEKGLDAGATATWCDAAAATGLLHSATGQYSVPPGLTPALTAPSDAAYLGHHFRYLARKSLTFGSLGDLLRGKSTVPPSAETYAIATAWDHVLFFDRVLPAAPSIETILRRGGTVLDLGAGHGAWGLAVLERYPAVRMTAADVEPAGLAAARTAASARKLDLYTHDLTKGPLPAGRFDLVFLGEVLAAVKEPADVLRGAREALAPGGTLCIVEGLLPDKDEAGDSPDDRLIRAMSFDFRLDGSRFLRKGEAAAAVVAAGFPAPRVVPLGGALYALVAERADGSGAAR